MRLLFTALLAGGLSLGLASPGLAQLRGGYRTPHRLHTSTDHQGYRRPPLRITLGVNVATYNGDITGRLPDNTLRVGFSAGIVKPLSPHLSLVSELSYVKLKAVDQRPDRGLSFQGTNGVLTAMARYNFLADERMFFGSARHNDSWQPFVQAGVGLLLFDPTSAVSVNGTTVALPPERRSSLYMYPHLAGVLPVGGGVTYRFSPYLALTLDGLYYFTSTDLLDDVSDRANPDKLDKFITAAFKVEIGLRSKKGKPLVHFD
ncbi:MAG: hypothetical protein EOO59_08930 [Hymenobacter sp.]|nr:MAG: hypothetical protein EOO59_08930 [Hymenobacter sp.]